MSLPYLPIGNQIDVVVEGLYAATDPTTPVTDAVMTWTLYDASGNTVAGCVAVAMPHSALGNYRGSATPTSALTEGVQYRLAITCSNYDIQWSQRYVAQYRAFDD